MRGRLWLEKIVRAWYHFMTLSTERETEGHDRNGGIERDG